jgi:hypothetical protein
MAKEVDIITFHFHHLLRRHTMHGEEEWTITEEKAQEGT